MSKTIDLKDSYNIKIVIIVHIIYLKTMQSYNTFPCEFNNSMIITIM